MNWFKKKEKESEPKSAVVTRGLLIFADTQTVMHAEQVLKEEEYDIRVVSPPPQYRTGCDLSIEFPMVSASEITKMLKKIGLGPIDVLPLSGNGSQPLKLYKTKDFGRYLMVRAANMKITIDKTDRKIVNISGGGCPDVPYLAWEMVGKTFSEAPEPGVIGFSLCAYSLGMARDEMARIIGEE
jgi:hypothetical protein